MTRRVREYAQWMVLGGLSLGMTGCLYTTDPAPGYHSGELNYVSTPASGANAQGVRERTLSNEGLAGYNTDRCYYPDVTALDRRERFAPCVNTFEVGAKHEGQRTGGEHRGDSPVH